MMRLPELPPLLPPPSLPLLAKGQLPRYRATLLPERFTAVGMNDRGEIVGVFETTTTDRFGELKTRAAYWNAGRLTLLPTAGRPQERAAAISNRGAIVGSVSYPPGPNLTGEVDGSALIWSSRTAKPRRYGRFSGILSGVRVTGINDAGRGIGNEYSGGMGQGDGAVSKFNWYEFAFLIVDGKRYPIGGGSVYAINERGEIAGSDPEGACLYLPGERRSLGKGDARALNNRGQVVIVETLTADKGGKSRANSFLYENGKRTDLSVVGYEDVTATSINDRGQIVGYARREDAQIAVLWQEGMAWELNGMIAPGGFKGQIENVLTINNKGQVLAAGPNRNETRYLLLTPV